MRRVFSGIQPTGIPHLGNYFGAIRPWVTLQDELRPAASAAPPTGELRFCIVDLHAMSSGGYSARGCTAAVRTTAAVLLACGLDASRVTLFRQSAVPAHCELAWLLACLTPLSWLDRMTQFKAKAAEGGGAAAAAAASATRRRGRGGGGGGGGGGSVTDSAGLGLYSYPVLQAADILLYRATEVPVGEDQHQHLELSRDLASAFNSTYCAADGGGGAFQLPLPRALTLAGGARRVMSLRDGRAKMSKSAPSALSRVELTDSDDAIADKVRRAKTDSEPGFSYEPARRPEKSNLLALAAAAAGEPLEAAAARYAGASAERFKAELAEALIACVAPLRERARRLLAQPDEIDRLLRAGAEEARAAAEETMREVRRAAGLSGGGGGREER